MLFRDDSAQWLLLSAIIVSIGLFAIVLLLNSAVLSGHSSSASILSFPKNEIRDLRSMMLQEAVLLGQDVNANASLAGSGKIASFKASYDRYIGEINWMYLLHGAIINVTYVPSLYSDVYSHELITNVTVSIVYYDSNTIYKENKTVGLG